MHYVLQVLLAIDQLINAVAGGWADESISSRSWRCRDESEFWAVMHVLIDALFFWQPQHCKQAYESERLRLQEPPEFRT